MRINPKYSNVCATRIGTWRDEQCWMCKFLTECDKLYDEKTGEFDYPIQWRSDKGKERLTSGRHKLTNREKGQRRNNAEV